MPNFSIPLSGLTAESTALSAIANNLANQNTTGYKDTSVLFSDLFYQNIGTSGSGDPIQVGAGTEVGSMPSLFTQGSVSATGVPTDVAIQGSGFFAVEQNGVISYTRAGDFSLDQTNNLVNSLGQSVLGYPAVNGIINTGTAIAPLQLGLGTISPPTPTTNVSISANLNATANPGDTFSTPVTIYDSLGASHILTFTYTNTAPGAWTYAVTIPAADVGAAGPGPVTVQAGALAFNDTGQLITPAANIPAIPVGPLADGAAPLSFAWQLFNNGVGNLTQVAGPSATTGTSQNGFGSGSLVNFTIGSDGTILGSFSNGKTQALGQLALTSFANDNGLQLDGNTNFTPTLASGSPVIGIPGTGGLGTISGGALELSNVDIATEFANLIVAQRGFEADAKAVTTFDQITQDTINLKQ